MPMKKPSTAVLSTLASVAMFAASGTILAQDASRRERPSRLHPPAARQGPADVVLTPRIQAPDARSRNGAASGASPHAGSGRKRC